MTKLTFRSFYVEAPILVSATREAIVIDTANKGRLALDTDSGMPGEMPEDPAPFDEPSLSHTPFSLVPSHRPDMQLLGHDETGAVMMLLSGAASVAVVGDYVVVLDVTYGGPDFPQVFSLRFTREPSEYLWLSPLPVWLRGRATPELPEPGQLSLWVHREAQLLVIRAEQRVSWLRFDELEPVLAARDADVTVGGPHWEVTYAVEAGIGPVPPHQTELASLIDEELVDALSRLPALGVLPSLTMAAVNVAVASLEADPDLRPRLGVSRPEPSRELTERTTTVALAHLATQRATLDPAEALYDTNVDRWPELFEAEMVVTREPATLAISSELLTASYHGSDLLDVAGVANALLEQAGDRRRYHPIFTVYAESAALLLDPATADQLRQTGLLAIGEPLAPPPRSLGFDEDARALIAELAERGLDASLEAGTATLAFDTASRLDALLLRHR